MIMSCTVKTFRFSLDPGPRGTDFIVEDLSTVTSLVAEPIAQDGDKMKLKNLVTLQAYCSSAALHLRWEVLELVEGIMKVMSTVTLESEASPVITSDGENEPMELQIVFGTDLAQSPLMVSMSSLLWSPRLYEAPLFIAHTAQNRPSRRISLFCLVRMHAPLNF